VVGLAKTRDTVQAAAGKVMAAAADTQKAVTGIAVLAAVALCIALLAVVLAVRARKPAAA